MSSKLFTFPPKQPNGWGPKLEVSVDVNLPRYPIENVNRYPPARVGKACDFTQATQERIRQMQAKEATTGKKNYWQPQQPLVVEDGYALVDTKSAARKKQQSSYHQRGRNYQHMQQKNLKQSNYQEGILGQNKKPKKVQQTQQTTSSKGNSKGTQHRHNPRNMAPMFRDWSIQVHANWNVVTELALTSFVKMSLDARMVKKEDMYWAGKMHTISKKYDRVTCRMPKVLPIASDVNFFNPTTTADETVEALMTDNADIDVAATDHIIAALMAAGRSVYSWDICFIKCQGKLFFEKRDNSPVDFCTVNESAQEPPSYAQDEKESINAPPKLAKEAARVNQNFAQAMVDANIEPSELEAHPFTDQDDAAAVAYRYRKIILPGNKKSDNPLKSADVTMLVRTEVHGKTASGTNVLCKCLNEFETKNATLTWRQHLEAQPGAILANELKNNAFKMGRWVGEAILGGCDQIKLGYATRHHPQNNMQHELVCVQTQPTGQLSAQISLSENNAFGIIRHIIDLLRDQEDGEYILLKDPNKPIIRLYAVPEGAFQSEDEEEEDGDEEEEESD